MCMYECVIYINYILAFKVLCHVYVILLHSPQSYESPLNHEVKFQKKIKQFYSLYYNYLTILKYSTILYIQKSMLFLSLFICN